MTTQADPQSYTRVDADKKEYFQDEPEHIVVATDVEAVPVVSSRHVKIHPAPQPQHETKQCQQQQEQGRRCCPRPRTFAQLFVIATFLAAFIVIPMTTRDHKNDKDKKGADTAANSVANSSTDAPAAASSPTAVPAPIPTFVPTELLDIPIDSLTGAPSTSAPTTAVPTTAAPFAQITTTTSSPTTTVSSPPPTAAPTVPPTRAPVVASTPAPTGPTPSWWARMGPVIASQSTKGELLALSDDGLHLAVLNRQSGQVSVWHYKEHDDAWQAHGAAIPLVNDQEQGDKMSMSLSGDGTTLAIGSPTYTYGGVDGAVRIYRYYYGKWYLGQTLQPSHAGQGFGNAVSLSRNGRQLAVGAEMGDEHYPSTPNVGKVHVFLDTSGGDDNNWQRFPAGMVKGAHAEFQLGKAVAMAANGNMVAATSSRESVANLYQYTSNYPNGFSNDPTVQLSDVGGDAVAVSEDCHVWVILDRNEDRIHVRWSGQSFLIEGVSANSIALAADGSTLVAGKFQGDALVYRLGSSGDKWDQVGRIILNQSGNGDVDTAVAISANGKIIAVGSPGGGNVNVVNLLD